MHDIDRTHMESEWELDAFANEGEYGDEYEGEYDGEYEGEYEGEAEIGEEYERDGTAKGESFGDMYSEMYGEMAEEAMLTHGLFTEMDEMALAADLLEVTDEAELDQFLGSLMRKAGQAAGRILRTPEGKALGGVLKGIARKALPKASAALDHVAPDANRMIGRQLAASAGQLFGLEMEGMSAEDQEFEVARRFVHLAGDAVQNVLQAAPKMPLGDAVQKAVATAAKQHAPGLLKQALSGLTAPDGDGRRRRRRQVAGAAEYADGQEMGLDSIGESPFSEAEEMALAAELLEITDEAELDQFLGKLFKKIGGGLRKAGRFLRPLGGALKGLAKKALPVVGGALGSAIPIPGVGTAVGSAVGSAVSNALEAELAGLQDEDQEFEKARRFVRIAGSAAQKAAAAQPNADPSNVVRKAVMNAAREHVPGLNQNDANTGAGQRQIRGRSDDRNQQHSRQGRWERRGRTIILHGI